MLSRHWQFFANNAALYIFAGGQYWWKFVVGLLSPQLLEEWIQWSLFPQANIPKHSSLCDWIWTWLLRSKWA